MECRHYEDEDAIHVTLRAGVSARTVQLDENRYVGYGEGGELMWASFLYVSEGVDLDDVFECEGDRAAASGFMEERDIRVFA